MLDEGQKPKAGPIPETRSPKKRNRTPLILAAGVLLILASNLLFKKMTMRVEPINTWNERTLIAIRAKNAAEFWQGTKDVFQTMDPEFNTALDKITLKTGKSPLDLAKEILPDPIELIVLEKEDSLKDNGLKYDFVLATKSSGRGIENIPAADAAAKDFASWFIPVNRYTTLDDGSKVKTQIADPKKIKMQKKVFNNEEITYISEARLPFEYARAHSGAWLFFGTSRREIEDIVAKHNQTIPFEVLARNCASPNKNVDVFFNPKVFNLVNKANLLILGSPLRGMLRMFNRNKTIVKTNGISVAWNSCSF